MHTKNEYQLKKLHNLWYFNSDGTPTAPVYEMVKLMRGRYLSFILPKEPRGILVRYNNCWFLDDKNNRLAGLLGFLRQRQNQFPLKLYMDNMTFDESKMIYFTHKKSQRDLQKDEFAEKMKNNYVTYDYYSDIDRKKEDDSPDIEQAIIDMRIEKELYDRIKLPYCTKFSGSKGFNFEIYSKWFPEEIKISARGDVFRKMSENIAKDLGIVHDLSTYLNTQIRKLSYSACGENVVMPLTDMQIERFDIEKVRIKYILRRSMNHVSSSSNIKKTINITNRGLLERNHGLSDDELRNNVAEFVACYA